MGVRGRDGASARPRCRCGLVLRQRPPQDAPGVIRRAHRTARCGRGLLPSRAPLLGDVLGAVAAQPGCSCAVVGRAADVLHQPVREVHTRKGTRPGDADGDAAAVRRAPDSRGCNCRLRNTYQHVGGGVARSLVPAGARRTTAGDFRPHDGAVRGRGATARPGTAEQICGADREEAARAGRAPIAGPILVPSGTRAVARRVRVLSAGVQPRSHHPGAVAEPAGVDRRNVCRRHGGGRTVVRRRVRLCDSPRRVGRAGVCACRRTDAPVCHADGCRVRRRHGRRCRTDSAANVDGRRSRRGSGAVRDQASTAAARSPREAHE